MNEGHDVMTNPWRRTFTALSYIRGPLVDDWVQLQVDALRLKTTRAAPPPLQRTDEALWIEWKTDFDAAFTDTTKQQTAYRELQELRMKGTDIDAFVAKFKRLATKAEFGLDDAATKDMFAKALNRPLLEAILGRETFIPRQATLAQWIAAAQAEIQRHEIKYSMLRKWPTTWQSPSKSNRGFNRPSYQSNSSQRSSYTHPNDRSVPMDVDVVRRATSEDQKKKFRVEGRCFECDKQGHMARFCPNKRRQSQERSQQRRPQTQPKPKQRDFKKRFNPKASFARVVEVEDDSDNEDTYTDEDSISEPDSEPNELNISDLAARTARFSDDQRDEWVTEMKKLGVDF